MTPRPYQTAALDALRRAYADGRRAPLLTAPTGSGKTVIFALASHGATARGHSVVIVTHREELLQQASAKLTACGVPHGLIAAGREPDPAALCQVASVATLVRRLDSVRPPRLLIIDEAQHALAGQWQTILSRWPDALRLGVTATPCRLDGQGLGDVFDSLVLGPSVSDLQAQGYLARARYWAPPQVADLSGLGTRAGDYAREAAAERMRRPGVTGDAVAHYQRLATGRRAVAFCVTVSHAETVATEFAAAGIPATSVDGSLSPQERADRLARFAAGEVLVLTSCDLISEGWDLPQVDAALLLRPTASLGLHLQQVGRVLRPAPGKDYAVVLDHVGNLERHGLAEEPREWSLAGKGRRPRVVLGAVRCPVCFAMYSPAELCPQCGSATEREERRRREIAQRAGELAEIEAAHARSRAVAERKAARSYEELVAIGREKGYRNPAYWARQVIQGRGGRR